MLRLIATRQRMALVLSLTLVWAVLALSHGRVVCIDSTGQRAIEPSLLGQCLPAMACEGGTASSEIPADSCGGAACQDELLGSIDSVTRHRVTTEMPPIALLTAAMIAPEPVPGWTSADVRLPVRRGPPLRSTSVLIAQTMVLRI